MGMIFQVENLESHTIRQDQLLSGKAMNFMWMIITCFFFQKLELTITFGSTV